MTLQLFLTLNKTHKITIHPFYNKLYKLFPNKPFQVYDDSGIGNGPYVFYPKYSDWSEYKKGEKIGIKLKNKTISHKKALEQIKNFIKNY